MVVVSRSGFSGAGLEGMIRATRSRRKGVDDE